MAGRAQSMQSGDKDPYGLDPVLYNGKFYSFFLPEGTIGNPFMQDNEFRSGTVTIRGTLYESVLLNYDIHNQQLILKYTNQLGATNLLSISDAWLEAFTIGDMKFEVIQDADTLKRFYQVLGSGPMRFCFYHSKEKILDYRLGTQNNRFKHTDTKRYLLLAGNRQRFYNNRSFIALFDTGKQIPIKKFLRQHKIKVNKSPDGKLSELINYCNTL